MNDALPILLYEANPAVALNTIQGSGTEYYDAQLGVWEFP